MTTTEIAPPGAAAAAPTGHLGSSPGVPPGSTRSLASRGRTEGVRFLLVTSTTPTGKPCAELVGTDGVPGRGLA